MENVIRDLTGLEQHDSIGELTDVGELSSVRNSER